MRFCSLFTLGAGGVRGVGALGHVGTAAFLSICQTRGSKKIISACIACFWLDNKRVQEPTGAL